MLLTKEIAKKILERDFIPEIIEKIDIRELEFRKTTNFEIHRCFRQTGYDSQSGPLYCGKIAEFIAITKDRKGIVTICEDCHSFLKEFIKIKNL
ncbi:hypothetical protein KKB71_01980 [Patescibacteria group bacterium]|nr:hypothetical protein [Patescibacteria group bacterium]MBU2263060.1 hypothetical protein [Patescibacteria group bacterium]